MPFTQHHHHHHNYNWQIEKRSPSFSFSTKHFAHCFMILFSRGQSCVTISVKTFHYCNYLSLTQLAVQKSLIDHRKLKKRKISFYSHKKRYMLASCRQTRRNSSIKYFDQSPDKRGDKSVTTTSTKSSQPSNVNWSICQLDLICWPGLSVFCAEQVKKEVWMMVPVPVVPLANGKWSCDMH